MPETCYCFRHLSHSEMKIIAIHQKSWHTFRLFAYFSSKSWIKPSWQLALFWRRSVGQFGLVGRWQILRSSIRCVCPVVQLLGLEPVIERRAFTIDLGLAESWRSRAEAAETIDFFCSSPPHELVTGNAQDFQPLFLVAQVEILQSLLWGRSQPVAVLTTMRTQHLVVRKGNLLPIFCFLKKIINAGHRGSSFSVSLTSIVAQMS